MRGDWKRSDRLGEPSLPIGRGQRQTTIATAPVLYSTCVLKAHVDSPVKVRSEEGPSHLCRTAAIVWGDLGDEARGKALFRRVSKPPVRNMK